MPVKDDFISYQNDSFSLIENKKKGIALLYLRLASVFPTQKENYKSKAKSLIDQCLRELNSMEQIICCFSVIIKNVTLCLLRSGKRISFIEGDLGPLAIAAVIYNDLHDEKMVNKCIEK